MTPVDSTLEIRPFRPEDSLGVEALFTRMYTHMTAHGLRLALATDGAKLWVESAARGQDRSSQLVVCTVDGELMGFAHGAIKLAPGYLGGEKFGSITHVFVEDRFRTRGLGRQLVKALEAWLMKQGSRSIELQVLCENAGAISFWRSLGYQDELLQLRRPINR